MELSVMSRREGARTVISVTGEIDVYTAPTLRERLNDLVAQGEYDLVVDMAGVEFLDSTGLGVLVGGLKRTRSHQGTLRLVCDQEKIIKVFRITGLTKVEQPGNGNGNGNGRETPEAGDQPSDHGDQGDQGDQRPDPGPDPGDRSL